MKKVIVSILALACGVCAYAKTLDELIEGMPEAIPSIKGGWQARSQFMEENVADFAREFNEYVSSGVGVKDYEEKTPKEKQVRRLLVPYYSKYGKSLNVPDGVAIRLSPDWFFRFTGIAKYEQIKSAGWKIDGKQLAPSTVFWYAKAAKDIEYKNSITLKQAQDGNFLEAWAKEKAKALYYADDVKAAYQEALDIEAALRSRGGNNADAITSLKAVVEVEDFLYLKFTRATKIK